MSQAEIVPAEVTTMGFYSADPATMISQVQAQATELAQVIDAQGLFAVISKKKHVTVEGWTTLGAMLGVFPVVEWTRELVDKDGKQLGWEARVEARTMQGAVVGAAEAECRRTENTWKSRDSYAIRSMAQTRATSKALRLPLGFIMALAGYEVTPEAEHNRGVINQIKREVLALVNGDKEQAAAEWGMAKQALSIDTDDGELTEEQVLAIFEQVKEGGKDGTDNSDQADS